MRREIEAKQLRYKQRYLQSIPSTKDGLVLKQKVMQDIDELVEGIVLLQKPDDLGWKLFFESRDCEDLGELLHFQPCSPVLIGPTAEYDRNHVKAYIRLFSESPLALLLRGYFAYRQEVLSEDEEDHDLYALSEDSDPVDTILVR